MLLPEGEKGLVEFHIPPTRNQTQAGVRLNDHNIFSGTLRKEIRVFSAAPNQAKQKKGVSATNLLDELALRVTA